MQEGLFRLYRIDTKYNLYGLILEYHKYMKRSAVTVLAISDFPQCFPLRSFAPLDSPCC